MARPTITMTVGGASFSLDWLWSKIRYVITGKKDIHIDGILMDSEDAPHLRVWVVQSSETWMEPLDRQLSSSALDEAIGKIALNIFELLEPVFLALISSTRWNYEKAIRLISAENRWQEPGLSLDIVRMSLEGEYLYSAEQQLQKLRRKIRLTHDQRMTLISLEANVQLRRGQFAEARKRLHAAIKEEANCTLVDVVNLRSSIAESFMYEGRLQDAVEEYDRAKEAADKEVCSAGQVSEWQEVGNRLLDDAQRDRVSAALWNLYSVHMNRARGKDMSDLDPFEDLQNAVSLVQVLGKIDPSSLDECDYREALASADLARCHFDRIKQTQENPEQSEKLKYAKERDLFEQANERALQLFEVGIEFFEGLEQSTDEYGELVNQAWRCYRKTSCCLLKRNLMREESPDELNVAAANLRQIFLSLPESRTKLGRLLQKTRQFAQEASQRFIPGLRQLTQCCLEAILIEYPSDQLVRFVEDLKDIPSESPLGKSTDVEFAPSSLSEAAETKWAQAGFDSDDRVEIYAKLGWLFHTFASEKDEESLNRLLDRIDVENAALNALQNSESLFNHLTSRPPKRVRAEGWYGRACVFAITGDAKAAAEYLRLASEEAGCGTFAYLNRARIDQDFDGIRSDDFFRAASSKSQAEVLTAAAAD